MKGILKKLILVIGLVPLIAGAIGYWGPGDRLTDALYASFALYFTNPVSDGYNGFVEFARWTAPLVTATAVLYVLRNVWNRIVWRFIGLSKDSVAVYSDEDIKIAFGERTKAIYPGECVQNCFKSHIILFSSDQKSLGFYEEHKAQLKGRMVYIGLRELELGLIKEVHGVTLFDINSSVSRNFWKKMCLWKQEKRDVCIVVYGESLLAQSILSVGLQLNLFSKEQHVTYHLVSDNQNFRIKHSPLPLMNGDEIIYQRRSEEGVWSTIEKADAVIVADQVSAETLQTISAKARCGSLYYYSPESGSLGDYIAFGKPIAFGRNEDIFTDENIRRQALVQAAMALNEKYAAKHGTERDWNRLSGFLKSSNISSADFQQVLFDLSESVPEEELAELEHIRWCRFYYLNYWKQGDPKNGTLKDDDERIHRDLVAYDALSDDEKSKNRAVVVAARGAGAADRQKSVVK